MCVLLTVILLLIYIGRPFAMKGRYYANIFIHFMPVPSKEQTEEGALPPYILKDSILAKTWENGGYDGEIPGKDFLSPSSSFL